MVAGTSTILTSATRHCTPNAPEPSLVIRLTTCWAGSDGGMTGAGGGVCAIDWIATVSVSMIVARLIAPAMAFRISSSLYYFSIKNVSRVVRRTRRAAQPLSRVAVVDGDVLAVRIAKIAQALEECVSTAACLDRTLGSTAAGYAGAP